MRLFKTCLAAAALSLAACTPAADAPPPSNTSSPAPIDAALSQARRAFAAAEIEWQSAIAVGRALVRHGVIEGGTAEQVRAWNADARRAIVAGKAATNAAGQAAATAELLRLTGLLDRITGRK